MIRVSNIIFSNSSVTDTKNTRTDAALYRERILNAFDGEVTCEIRNN
jgi:hypothetical protein